MHVAAEETGVGGDFLSLMSRVVRELGRSIDLRPPHCGKGSVRTME